MTSNPLGELALTFGLMSLMAIGGANAMVPEIHRQVVDVRHWIDEPGFLSLFALSQVTPGPNVLLVSLIGWQLAGLPGLAVATAAMVGPSSLLALAAGRTVRRFERDRWLASGIDALTPIGIGLILAAGLTMGEAAMAQPAAAKLLDLAIIGGAAAYVMFTDRNPLWAIGLGAAAAFIRFMLT